MGRTAWVLVLLGGCGVEPASACPGAAPALTECALGVYHADCGGDGAPAFACDEVTGACRWFTGGCVASGHRVSDCPIEDRCCHESADGPWAFADGWVPTSRGPLAAATRVLVDVDVVGATPIGSTGPFDLEVTIDPTVVAPAGATEVSCEGALGAQDMCPSRPYQMGPLIYPRAGDTFALELRPSVFGPTLLVEVLEDGGRLRGRVFPGYQTDVDPPIPADCGAYDWAGELTGGTLRIDRLEAGAHGELVVHAVEGGTITVRF